jgi:hypothetical protein
LLALHPWSAERRCSDAGAPIAATSRALLADAYRGLAPRCFSKEVLERLPGLAALELRDAGWSDLGTPRRVLAALRPSVGSLRRALDELALPPVARAELA